MKQLEASGQKQKDLYSIDWTRFGDITIDKWSIANQDWALLQ